MWLRIGSGGGLMWAGKEPWEFHKSEEYDMIARFKRDCSMDGVCFSPVGPSACPRLYSLHRNFAFIFTS